MEILGGVSGVVEFPKDGEHLSRGFRARRDYMYGRAATIYGGSNEVQRNVIAKAVLGL